MDSRVDVLRRGGVQRFDSLIAVKSDAASKHHHDKIDQLKKDCACFQQQATIAVDEQNELRRRLQVQAAMTEKMLDFILSLRVKLASDPAHAGIMREIDDELRRDYQSKNTT